MSVLSSVFIFPEIFYLYYSVSRACLKNHFRKLGLATHEKPFSDTL